MSWTEEKVNKLRELWGKGQTASQIAEIIGGISRNAVIGKAHRLNLEARAPSKRSRSDKSEAPKPQTKFRGSESRKSKFKSILLDKNFEPENPKILETLTDSTCKWPIGHPNEDDFYFCGRKSVEDFSYCKLHILYAFQPKNQKEDDLGEEIPEFIEKKVKSAG